MTLCLPAPPTIPAGTAFAFCDHEDADPDAVPPDLHGAARRRRLDHAAGRRAAADALRVLTGRAAPVPRADSGAPVWPAGISGAISHAQGRAVAIVGWSAHHAGLGIDLESVTRRPQDLARVTLAPHERAQLGPQPDATTITLSFSAKESLFKALYPSVQEHFGFDAAEIIRLDRQGGVLRLCRALPPWGEGSEFPFHWTIWRGQVLTLLAATHVQARSVAPPST
ncbi:4'-phosphopantetheinyl transferase family protein [Paracoccus fistulariae]|uniref:Enterobactin synthase component D n=1 Tax=Paracoccus fistulariae TaxID=658446 RepID=A0ABY7SG71_9RHOB|nr:4'-phosphopantetheinyl transferase superfamily protein [Paracoccus fistulariae]MDB6181837.1 4'-phosphopantetheinyl transferase superfamily protein [Paracoccus fistulariae]WCR05874.1 4'-phosphopantetheinyl transferase superfamily protein [Paracoccus fistulariae]